MLNEIKKSLHYSIAKSQNNNSVDFYSAIHAKIVTFYYKPCKFILQEGKVTHKKVPGQFFFSQKLLGKIK